MQYSGLNATGLTGVVIRCLPTRVRQFAGEIMWLQEWVRSGFAPPLPPFLKRRVLRRYGGGFPVWIETGTFLGDTTAAMARWGATVHTIEPSSELVARARKRFSRNDRVTIHEGLSEDVLPELLRATSGPLALWLDGHRSGPDTHHGPVDSPIKVELAAITRFVDKDVPLAVFIDDMRMFPTEPHARTSYPSRSDVVRWADDNAMRWIIESDIFVALRHCDGLR